MKILQTIRQQYSISACALRTRALLFLAIFFTMAASAQRIPVYTLNPYTPNDGGILVKMTANGKWGIIQLGNSQSGGTATPKLYDADRGTAIEIVVKGNVFDIADVSDDGNIVVGSMMGKPASYNRATDKLTYFPMRPMWMYGSLSNVTPDGKWAVGSYDGYKGQVEDEDFGNDFCFSTLLVNVETGDTIATPGLPKLDMAHLDQHAIVFDDITPDGRYAIGVMSWFIMQPNSGFTFVYDTQEHTYRVIGFTEHPDRDWEPVNENLFNLCGGDMSPDGHWLAGMAYMRTPIEGSQFFREFGIPYRYDLNTSKLELLEDVDLNVANCLIDNAGTLFVNPEIGGPLRDFRILFQDKHWISLSQICSQYYGFDFSSKTGFGRTGTIAGISGDGSRLVSYPDPLGESYFMDLNQPIEEICENIDLLSKYTITPVDGSVCSQISTVSINFGRSVQVLGTGKNVHLYKADGTKVSDGLTAGNQGLQLKAGSLTTVNAVFRTRALEAGEKYYVVLDAGAVAVANDASRTNKEIRVDYVGRANGPVKSVEVTPANHSQLRQLDGGSYIRLAFDCPIMLTENPHAFIQRCDDGSVVSQLSIAQGNTEETMNQILLYTNSTVSLYDGVEYKVVLEAGSVCDCSMAESSYNERVEVTYHGTYVRESDNESVLFADDFEDVAWSYANWMRYDGDQKQPSDLMLGWFFNDKDFPWQFGMADDASRSNMFAGSHSMYTPAAQSDDWMMTQQIHVPETDRTVLSFDAQNYLRKANDVLNVYVFEEDFEIPYLNAAWMEDVRSLSQLLDQIKLTPGQTEELTSGEWTHYEYDLSKWAGKNIYIAFANQNMNQSAIFVDNVLIERDQLYALGFSNANRVVNQDAITIAGQLTLKKAGKVQNATLVLKDAEGAEVSRVEWTDNAGLEANKPLAFTFAKPLSLQKGKENAYSIDVVLDGQKSVYEGSVFNLVFEPTKRVVLEELTGINCPNCPQGILGIEKCEKAFGDRFIPISIHTYTGDPYGSGLSAYTQFLGLIAAPSARINRTPDAYIPIVAVGDKAYDTHPVYPAWYDIVTQELQQMTVADLDFTATLSADESLVHFDSSVRYALDAANQQLSLFVVMLEDGIVSYQENNFGALEDPVFGEWGAGGLYSSSMVYPVVHNDVARSVIGQSFNGTIGLFPATLESGKTYSATFSSKCPENILNLNNAHAVAILIDSQTGQVINAAKASLKREGADAVSSPTSERSMDVYSLSGMRVLTGASKHQLRSLPAGIYVVGGKKVVVK